MNQECPQLAALSENVRRFWEEKQAKLQDTLLRFSYAVLTLPSGFTTVEKSGLLYLMKHNLWFEDFPKSSTFATLFQRSSQYEKMLLQLPLETVEQVQVLPQVALDTFFVEFSVRSNPFQWIARMFGIGPKYLCVTGKDVSGHDVRYAFRDVTEPEVWEQAIIDR
jgi:hypothetical protein